MITVKDFMEIVDFRITEGGDYCWQCYGPNAYILDSWNQDQDGHTVSIVFDTRSHVVYETCAYDYKHNRAYRLINPDYKSAHSEEARSRDVDFNQAWDDVNFVDLETDEDFLEKARSIVADEDYDTRVEVPLTLPDDQLFELMKLAHESDMTLNQYVEKILRQAIDSEGFLKNLEEMRDEYDFTDSEQGPVAESVKKIKKRKKGRM
jgi:hypothetical protein